MIEIPKNAAENIRWRMHALERGAKDPAAAHALAEECRGDILFWVNTF